MQGIARHALEVRRVDVVKEDPLARPYGPIVMRALLHHVFFEGRRPCKSRQLLQVGFLSGLEGRTLDKVDLGHARSGG